MLRPPPDNDILMDRLAQASTGLVLRYLIPITLMTVLRTEIYAKDTLLIRGLSF